MADNVAITENPSGELAPEVPPAQPLTVSSGGFLSIAKGFAQHFPLLSGLYLAGYFRMSPLWIVGAAGLTVAREMWQKERDVRMNAARLTNLADEEDIIKACLVDLPSWVMFPDYERAEWVNKILKSVWPGIANYVETLIRDSIEPSIIEALTAYKLNVFQFDKLRLGVIPLRVGGVKVYDRNVSRDEIIMDLDVCYAGDCDFSFRLKGVKAGIRDIQIKGILRCQLKPLVDSSPFVGGVQIFFLNKPDVDFNLSGAADFLDMTGLGYIMRRIISEQIESMMVLQNQITLQLSEIMKEKTLKMHEPAGVLRVRLIQAKDLMKMDIVGKSDPYAVFNFGSQEFRTKTIMHTLNPTWDHYFEIIMATFPQGSFELKIRDFNRVVEDDDLGRASIMIGEEIRKAGKKAMSVKLEEARSGMVHIELTWFSLSPETSRLKDHTSETICIGLSSAVVTVYLDCAKMLPCIPNATGTPDAYVLLSVGNEKAQTKLQPESCDPIWEEAFSFLVCNPESDNLHLKVMDRKTQKDIGICQIAVASLLTRKDLMMSHQPLALKNSGPESKIVVSVQLRES